MKPKYRSASRFASLSTVIFAGVLAASSAQAVSLYRDDNATAAGTTANPNGT